MAKHYGFGTIVGEYIPTAKNQMVRDHYLNLGFVSTDGFWKLEVQAYIEKENFITKI